MILLDVSGSMDYSSNAILNVGAGVLVLIPSLFMCINNWNLGSFATTRTKIASLFGSRLQEAKFHLTKQIKNLNVNRLIEKLG